MKLIRCDFCNREISEEKIALTGRVKSENFVDEVREIDLCDKCVGTMIRIIKATKGDE